MLGFLKKIFGTQQDRLLKKFRKVVMEINREEQKLQSLSESELKGKTAELKARFQKGESLDDLLVEGYAVVKNACRRMCGVPVHVSGYDQLWDMVPYDVQLVSGIAMHKGTISEMHTGEGKTLTAVLPLYLNAISGKPVHLVTVNDYLAKRDAEWVGSILRYLGLTTGVLTTDVATHQRKEIYLSDVVYGTASEFGFDYLRDNSMSMSKEEQVQRGYYFAMIDEVDSILIDEARTPLIISGPVPESRQMYDELKTGVAELVKMQRDFCNKLVTEAKKTLEQKPDDDEALEKLWIVSKGTPQNKTLKKLKEEAEIRSGLDKKDLYFHNDQNKKEKLHALAALYFTIDERGSEFEITDKGIESWASSEAVSGSPEDFIMLDLGHLYHEVEQDPSLSVEQKIEAKVSLQREDSKRKERSHNMRQLLRAHLLMEKDVDYIIHDGKIVIIDENTGRPQPGRRFSDGLHQAIEAKEGVAIQKETQTYATITLQNYFRMYEKISGMTGTAVTEAHEFKEIYKLDVLEIPTNKPSRRVDLNDEIYMTEREKYNAILKDVKQVNGEGRPILIGTESVEISEKLSRILKQNKIDHTVLNAKQNDREAEIIAHAGRRAAVTIATNMAGRGTDIKLEKGIADLGGLYVLGTSRHRSRRIDRQLRGRSARQGDPGFAKFYLSFEDELLRLFANSSMTSVIQRFRPPEGEPISAKILNRSIETAQKRIEQRNYMMRKHTLEYDDVMNRQRREIYGFRNDLLHMDDLRPLMDEILQHVIDHAASEPNFRETLITIFPLSFDEDSPEEAYDQVKAALDKKLDNEKERVGQFSKQNPLLSISISLDEIVRDMLIRMLDKLWIEHLLGMDHLRTDVTLRSLGQRDPLMEFKQEAFQLFGQFSTNLYQQMARALFRFQIVPAASAPAPAVQAPPQRLEFETDRSLVDTEV